jgi:catechol 2,3-dioxygenase-like lactoylglutathione lyase family enzyme
MQRATPRVSRILETSLYVRDLERSRIFYERVFGFSAMFHDERMCALEVPGEQVLLLFRHGMTDQPAPVPGGLIPPHHGRGALHLAFAIPMRELAAWDDHLSRQDVGLESRVDWPAGGVSLYFRDPDGHSLEVATPGLWQTGNGSGWTSAAGFWSRYGGPPQACVRSDPFVASGATRRRTNEWR